MNVYIDLNGKQQNLGTKQIKSCVPLRVSDINSDL